MPAIELERSLAFGVGAVILHLLDEKVQQAS